MNTDSCKRGGHQPTNRDLGLPAFSDQERVRGWRRVSLRYADQSRPTREKEGMDNGRPAAVRAAARFVTKRIEQRCTPCEKRYLSLFVEAGSNYREVARQVKRNPTTVRRVVKAARQKVARKAGRSSTLKRVVRGLH